MKKISKKNLDFLKKLMGEFNSYSELVALNYYQGHDKETLEWNRGHLYCIEEMLKEFAELNEVNLVFTCGTHPYKFSQFPFLEVELEYKTVNLEGEDPRYHINSYGFWSK